ncbi:MAG: hypothetical protein IKN55_03530 [Oscillospiraceae bacterium]|nr:hypothetical protein [Oscillospiraceae bacterium]
MYKVKGYAANPVAIIIGAAVCVVAGVAIGAYGMYAYMSAHQGGLGDGEELAPFEESVGEVPSESIPLVTEPPTEAMTQPSTQAITSVEIVVAGNGYLYADKPVTLDGILGILQVMKTDMPVKVTDENASLAAYRALIDLLKEQNVAYIEAVK